MTRFIPIRILKPYGPVRVIVSALAIVSAVALYLGFPSLARSPYLFAILAALLFAFEVAAFEVGERRLVASLARRASRVSYAGYAELRSKMREIEQLASDLQGLLEEQGAADLAKRLERQQRVAAALRSVDMPTISPTPSAPETETLILESLTPRQQQIVQLYFHSKMPIDEIASRLEVTRNFVVRTWLLALTLLPTTLRSDESI